jgi:alkylhydroperoxidase/carboxymuconolactone decarboxylase family protein YurZ
MQWHIEQAAAAGATYEEVLEAFEIGIEMGGGPATVSARLALQVMEAVYEKQFWTAHWLHLIRAQERQ